MWSFLCYASICVIVVEAHKVEQACFEYGPRESSVNGCFNPNSVCLGSLILSCWIILILSCWIIRVSSYSAADEHT